MTDYDKKYLDYHKNLLKKASFWFAYIYSQDKVLTAAEIEANTKIVNKGFAWVDLPVRPSPPQIIKEKPEFVIKEMITKTGYGKATSGYIKMVKGDEKSFGVTGQSAGSSGYVYPEEVQAICQKKYLGVNIYPIDPDFK